MQSCKTTRATKTDFVSNKSKQKIYPRQILTLKKSGLPIAISGKIDYKRESRPRVKEFNIFTAKATIPL